MSISDSLAPRKLWSSIYRAIAVTVMFSMALGGLLLTQPQSAEAQTAAVVTDWLNLRTGPSTNDGVILVMSPGDAITVNGDPQGGFYPVTHSGNTGFAHADWISIGGSAPPASSNTGNTGTAYVIDGALNLRSGASLNNSVITVMPNGAPVTLTGEAAGGFLGVVYNGTAGWAWGEYLNTSGSAAPAPAPSAPAPVESGNPGVGDTVVGTMRTTDRLNMRSGPGTSYGIITTLVNGATVEIMGSAQSGFYPVRYGGNKGWMHGDWLVAEGAGVPGPPSEAPAPNPSAPAPETVGDTVTGTMNVTTGLNLREGPGTNYNVLTVMPGGVSVSVMGAPVNGFYPLEFHGTKGWASGDYLTTGAVNAPNPGGGAYTRDEIIQIIYAAADEYGQPRADMLRVAQCESVLDPNAVNASSGTSGLFQFLPSTWATTPFANQDIFDPVANAEATGWMWQNGRRNEWHCQ